MTPDEIRALYVETLARAEFGHFCKTSTWEEVDESDRQTWMPNAERAVDALAAAGLLPIYAGYQWVYEPDGTPLGYRERQLLTDWRDAALACSSCGVTERQCERWRGGTGCCPDCRHPYRVVSE